MTGLSRMAHRRPVRHRGQPFQARRSGVRLRDAPQDVDRPVRQLGMQAVVHPLPAAFVVHDAKIAQMAQVPRHPGLRDLQRMDELADAQPPRVQQQQQAAQARAVGQGAKESFGLTHMPISTCHV
ncbi:MAG: hypothetical protein U5L06_03905 [Rhodovibrio sp.]|nr:hypothetical protein [Rhodovibrio sp.]